MGYCDSGCEHLTSRHNCKKYHKGLTYSSYSSKSLSCSSHERCSECEKDHYIKELQSKLKKVNDNLTDIVNDDNGYHLDFRDRVIGVLGELSS